MFEPYTLKRIIEREHPCNPSATPFKLFGLGNWRVTPALVAMRNPVPWLSRHRRIFPWALFSCGRHPASRQSGPQLPLPVEKYPSLSSAQACSSPEKNASQAQARAELAAAAAAAAKSLPSGLDPRSRWRLRTQAAGTAAVAGASARERVEHPASAARPR